MRLVHEKGVVTASFLRKLGVSYQRMLKYRHSGWLDALGVGAFCEAGTHPSFDKALVALVEQAGLPVHIGGRTALARKGYLHFVPFRELPTTVFVSRGVRLPAWFVNRYSGRFRAVKTNFISGEEGIAVEEGCPVSAPERAILEFLHGVPSRQSLAEAYQIMEMLQTLRPRLVSNLLSECSSVKVKRLFCLLADDLDEPWWPRIAVANIDLGSGCRVIDKGGSFNAKYNLVVKPWREI